MTDTKTLADRIEDLLPQTQCTKCGYAACRPYAEAIAQGTADYNQCPPGGHEGIVRLAGLLGRSVISLNPGNGHERPRPLAVIDENICIGCTLCIQACPVDAIVGAPKQMHTVVAALCTGCDLCVAPCPVDCIEMVPVTGTATGWQAWSPQQAEAARVRHDRHLARLRREQAEAEQRNAVRLAARAPAAAAPGTARGASDAKDDAAEAQKRATIQAALERARKKKEELAAQGFRPKNIDAPSRQTQAQIDAVDERRRKLGLKIDANLDANANASQNAGGRRSTSSGECGPAAPGSAAAPDSPEAGDAPSPSGTKQP